MWKKSYAFFLFFEEKKNSFVGWMWRAYSLSARCHWLDDIFTIFQPLLRIFFKNHFTISSYLELQLTFLKRSTRNEFICCKISLLVHFPYRLSSGRYKILNRILFEGCIGFQLIDFTRVRCTIYRWIQSCFFHNKIILRIIFDHHRNVCHLWSFFWVRFISIWKGEMRWNLF